MFRRGYRWAILVGGLAVTGCGPSLSPVEGVVTMNSAPVSGANVTFVSEGGNKTYSAPTNNEGKFTLMTGDKPGIEAGKYKVLVVKHASMAGTENLKPSDPEYAKLMQKSQKDAEKAGRANMPPGFAGGSAAPAQKSELPATYGSAETTPLSVTVPLSSSPVALELQSGAPKK